MNIYDYRTIPPEESAYHARAAGTDAFQPEADDNPGARHMAKADDTHSEHNSTAYGAAHLKGSRKRKGEG